MKTAATTAEVRTTAVEATALVRITLVTLAIALFINCHIIANIIVYC
jgi:hypothetical protein